jgi:hypothetical protein
MLSTSNVYGWLETCLKQAMPAPSITVASSSALIHLWEVPIGLWEVPIGGFRNALRGERTFRNLSNGTTRAMGTHGALLSILTPPTPHSGAFVHQLLQLFLISFSLSPKFSTSWHTTATHAIGISSARIVTINMSTTAPPTNNRMVHSSKNQNQNQNRDLIAMPVTPVSTPSSPVNNIMLLHTVIDIVFRADACS